MKDRSQFSRFSFPIRVHLFVAIISFVLLLGIVLGAFHYQKISQLIIGEAQRMFDRVAENVTVNFSSTYRPVKSSVDLLSFSALLRGKNYQARKMHLPMLASVLEKNPEMTALEVGYANKEYFIIRKLNSDYLTTQFSAPPRAMYVVDNIETDSGVGLMQRYYYDEALHEISSKDLAQTSYDPTVRPWFKTAQNSTAVVSTKPYLFYFIGEVGFTVGKFHPENGSVVAADITLSQLSDTLRKSKITPSTKLFIINEGGHVLASSGEGSLVMDSSLEQTRLKTVAELKDPTLSGFWDLSTEQKITDDSTLMGHKEWLAASRKIKLAGETTFSLVILSPKAELLSEALIVRNQSVLITTLIILLSIPAALSIATKISSPLKVLARQTSQVRRFDFTQPVPIRSAIVEIGQLGYSMQLMQDTIHNFVEMIKSVAGERDFERLLENITEQTIEVSSASGAAVFLMSEDETQLTPACSMMAGSGIKLNLSPVSVNSRNPITEALNSNEPIYSTVDGSGKGINAEVLNEMKLDKVNLIVFPLKNRQLEPIGVLCLVFDASSEQAAKEGVEEEKIEFIKAVTGFSALTIESSKMVQTQKDLLEAFIKLIAGAIDEKSPYTGGHCQRVPVLTKMLAQAACDSNAPKFSDFNLKKEQWEELHIASWLHDCGKVTTPEYVVDKSTKLETIYDRIHEIRMRFEVIKKERELTFWKAIANGESKGVLEPQLQADLKQLDDDFAFVAECNAGGEFMASDKIRRLAKIADHKWLRTLDDRLGLSWEELQRKSRIAPSELPVEELLLANRDDHLIPRSGSDKYGLDDNPWGFKLDVPEYKLNRGELYNLSIEKGTLSKEERFIINNHIVQTIIMLEKLPFPKHMKSVPEIAGGHHEQMDGAGYPKRLHRDQMPVTARMMAIADIFEALTASDRPYKKAKTVSEAIRIMSFMKAEQHIDGDLFDLFLSSGVYRDYADQYLLPEQLDEVDISQYLAKA